MSDKYSNSNITTDIESLNEEIYEIKFKENDVKYNDDQNLLKIKSKKIKKSDHIK